MAVCAVEIILNFVDVNAKPLLPDGHKRDEFPLVSFNLLNLPEDIFHDRTESRLNVIVKLEIVKVAEKEQKRLGDES